MTEHHLFIWKEMLTTDFLSALKSQKKEALDSRSLILTFDESIDHLTMFLVQNQAEVAPPGSAHLWFCAKHSTFFISNMFYKFY